MTTPLDDTATIRIAGTDPQAPLLLVLHGFGANERDLLPLLEHLDHHGDAALLRAPLALGPHQWAWFPLRSIDVPDPASVQAAADAVLAWLDGDVDDHGARDVVVLGFSQGSTVALHAARTAPHRFRALVVLSGFVVPAAHDGDAALAAASPPAFFGHGTADAIIPPDVTDLTGRWLREHTTLTEHRYAGLGHGVGVEELDDLRAFLAALGPDSPS